MTREVRRIYMDCCCLNRPFDDQSQHRIRLEGEVVLEILSRCSRLFKLVGSEVLSDEIQQIPTPERKNKVKALYSVANSCVKLNEEIVSRPKQMKNTFSLDPVDALHVASAESQADLFLTTDDDIISSVQGSEKRFDVLVDNPVPWYYNQLTHE